MIRVQMFGEFSMFLGETKLALKSNPATKPMQILEYLLCHAPEVVPANTLIQRIYGYNDILNPKNNMKVSISQLRKLLLDAGLPAGKYIVASSDGYSWDPQVPATLDTACFEEAVNQARGTGNKGERLAHYRRAIDLYKGNFLPFLVGIDWAEERSAYYSKLFAQIVSEYIGLLREEGLWEEILPAAEKAYQLQPSEDWEILRIEGLMNLNRWEEAKAVYSEAVADLSSQFGLPPSDALVRQYQEICSRIPQPFSTMLEVSQAIQESSSASGAYYSSFPGFVDLYRVAVRSMLRNGVSCCLMLLSVTNREGAEVTNPKRLEQALPVVTHSIQSALRSSDFFARYNRSQFIICLSGTSLENCSLLSQRILRHYQQAPVRGVHLQFECKPAEILENDAPSLPHWR